MAETAEQNILDISQLGARMDATLPFRPTNWFVIAMHARTFTEKVLFPISVETGDEVYRRVWLERTAAKRAGDSDVEMLADYVVVNPELDNQENQFARHGRMIARFCDGSTTLEAQLPEAVTLDGMIEWVDAIAKAEKEREIKRAVGLTHIPLSHRANLDSVPGMSYPLS